MKNKRARRIRLKLMALVFYLSAIILLVVFFGWIALFILILCHWGKMASDKADSHKLLEMLKNE